MNRLSISSPYLVMSSDGAIRLTLNLIDGNISVAQDVSLDDFSSRFWRAVRKNVPQLRNRYIKKERQAVAKQLLKGDKIIQSPYMPIDIDCDWYTPDDDDNTIQIPSHMTYPNVAMPYPDTGVSYPITGVSYPNTGMSHPNTGNPIQMSGDETYIYGSSNSTSFPGIHTTPDNIDINAYTGANTSVDFNTVNLSQVNYEKMANTIMSSFQIYIDCKSALFRSFEDSTVDKQSIVIDPHSLNIKTSVKEPAKYFNKAILNTFVLNDVFRYHIRMKEL